ncbi:MAG TPA: DUF4886 domain-containing protein [Acidimicrobiia bacterium]|nr:DUF4886 domain-containing protein [Acidimicrobiia bacterium]
MTEPELRPPPQARGRESSFLIVWLVLIIAIVVALVFAYRLTGGVRVLFIGNSHTFSNDLPTMVDELATSGGMAISTEMIAIGGAWLADHARSPEVATALSEGDYDFVVLQEQSMAPADPGVAQESTYPAARQLAQMASAGGAEIVFFQTWAHRGGNQDVGHGSFASMQDAITATYSDLAVRYAGDVAPAGEAWRAHFTSGSSVPLHADDGYHPNPSGSYLAAAVIAATISDIDPREFAWWGPLEETAARAMLESAHLAIEGQ